MILTARAHGLPTDPSGVGRGIPAIQCALGAHPRGVFYFRGAPHASEGRPSRAGLGGNRPRATDVRPLVTSRGSGDSLDQRRRRNRVNRRGGPRPRRISAALISQRGSAATVALLPGDSPVGLVLWGEREMTLIRENL